MSLYARLALFALNDRWWHIRYCTDSLHGLWSILSHSSIINDRAWSYILYLIEEIYICRVMQHGMYDDSTTMLNYRTYSVCPYAVSVQCNLLYNKKFKFRNFQVILAVLFGSVQYVIHQIEMQRVWPSTVSYNASKVAKQIWGASLDKPQLADAPNSS
jgi:hypothetical protein